MFRLDNRDAVLCLNKESSSKQHMLLMLKGKIFSQVLQMPSHPVSTASDGHIIHRKTLWLEANFLQQNVNC